MAAAHRRAIPCNTQRAHRQTLVPMAGPDPSECARLEALLSELRPDDSILGVLRQQTLDEWAGMYRSNVELANAAAAVDILREEVQKALKVDFSIRQRTVVDAFIAAIKREVEATAVVDANVRCASMARRAACQVAQAPAT